MTPDKLYIDSDYNQVSAPKTEKAFRDLRADIVRVGKILKPIIHDENGGILDGKHRFIIWKDLGGLKLPMKEARFPTKKDAVQWVANQVHTEKKVTKQQRMILAYRSMCLEEGTVKERAQRMAKAFPLSGTSENARMNQFEQYYYYGTLILSDKISRKIYDYVWSGNGMVMKELLDYAKLTHAEQEAALKAKIETHCSWKASIRRAKVMPEDVQMLTEAIATTKASLDSLFRAVDLCMPQISNAGLTVPDVVAKAISKRSQFSKFEQSIKDSL